MEEVISKIVKIQVETCEKVHFSKMSSFMAVNLHFLYLNRHFVNVIIVFHAIFSN